MNSGRVEPEGFASLWESIRADQEEHNPIIEHAGKRYRWSGNSGFEDISYASVLARNQTEMYFALARRGVGIIPELMASDLNGEVLQTGFGFYAREELSTLELVSVGVYLAEHYPNQFGSRTIMQPDEYEEAGRGEMQFLVDEALEETGIAARLVELDSQ